VRTFFAVLLIAGCCGAQPARSISSELGRAGTDGRIGIYQRLIAASPSDLRLQLGLANVYLQKLRETADSNYLARASAIADRVLAADGGLFEALRLENEIDLQKHDFRSVAERSRDMLKYAPSDPGTWGNLGDALMDLGEYDEAGHAYGRMFALGPNLASYNRAAYFRFVTGDAPRAIALMKEAIEAGSDNPENGAWCLAELGDLYFKTGQTEAARRSYEEALERFPTLHRAAAGLARIEASRGHFAAAIRFYKRAQSIIPLPDYAAALEDLYSTAGDRKWAREQRDLLETIDRLSAARGEKTNRNLAIIFADHDRELQRALEMVRTEILSRPDVYTWDALSWVLLKTGQVDQARAASAKALRLHTPEPAFYFHASRIAAAAGDDRAACTYAERSKELNPKFAALEALAGAQANRLTRNMNP
jgi:tetratricopeptide (TPR) repeat protein